MQSNDYRSSSWSKIFEWQLDGEDSSSRSSGRMNDRKMLELPVHQAAVATVLTLIPIYGQGFKRDLVSCQTRRNHREMVAKREEQREEEWKSARGGQVARASDFRPEQIAIINAEVKREPGKHKQRL